MDLPIALSGSASASPVALEPPVVQRHVIAFEERYGVGSFARLERWLHNPDLSFAEIASRFGVSRERVRQWHRQWTPAAPGGKRRRLVASLRSHRRRVLSDPLVRLFLRHAHGRIEANRIDLVRSRDGFRSRSVQIDRRLVALHDASRSRAIHAGSGTTCYRVLAARGGAEFLYVRLTDHDFVFLPAASVPTHGALFVDGPTRRLARFKNTFLALAP